MARLRWKRSPGGRAGLLLSALLGCGPSDGAPGSAEPTAKAAAPGAATLAPSSSSPPAVELGAFCAAVCAKAGECGLRHAEALVRGGPAADKASLEKARGERAEVERACVESCAKAPVAGEDQPALRRANECLAQKDCDAFKSCLGGVSQSP